MNHDYMHTVSKELTEKAVKMLLSGATLVSEPCPYCNGVRVIKDGFALCVNCGKQPEEKPTQTKSVEEEPVKPLSRKLLILMQCVVLPAPAKFCFVTTPFFQCSSIVSSAKPSSTNLSLIVSLWSPCKKT